MTEFTNEDYIIYIENNIKEDLSLQSIADYFGYSKYHFCRMFKSQMNISVMEYVWSRKLVIATDEILKGKRIIDVAEEFGWETHSGFTKSFKRKYGFSPSMVKLLRLTLENLGGSLMNGFVLDVTRGEETKEELTKCLVDIVRKKNVNISELLDVIKCAEKYYEGLKRYSGDEYITHSLNVAIILALLEVEIYVIEAGLFCDADKRIDYLNDINIKLLPKKVKDIVEEFRVKDFDKLSEEALLIKAADRLHNMRTIEFLPEEKRKQKVQDTINYFIPIARKLENKVIIDELNNISIKYC